MLTSTAARMHEPRADEVAEAYGDRQIPKLVSVLRLSEEQLPEAERLHCLKLFSNLLSTQETKVRAIQAGALQPLLAWLGNDSSSAAVRQLCCRSIGSICQLQQGRAAFTEAGGIPVLTKALETTPDAAVAAMKVLACCADGRSRLHASPARVTAALVELVGHPGSSWAAATDAVVCITGLCYSDEGVIDALACQAPRCLQQLSGRALKHHACLSQAPQPPAAAAAQLLAALRAAAEALLVVGHHADGKAQLRQSECIPVLAGMLGVADGQVQASAAACLAALAIEVDSKVPVVAAAAPALIKLAQGGEPVAATAARTALLCAAEHLDARRKLELLLKPNELQALLQPVGQLQQVPPDYKYVVWSAEPLPPRFGSGDGAAGSSES
ncbi:hypothetical protein OEZ86_012463 [Tetradesmus obliquus]|nr:hypothetical protein OEZ86_012463 [Tetradesmus obliquus]